MLKEEPGPFEELVEKLNPDHALTVPERNQVRNMGSNVNNVVKSSLINLLMGQFSKISAYEAAIGNIITKLAEKTNEMDTDELISLLHVLTKVNASETKNVMDLFKKNDSDVQNIIKELQKLAKEKPSMREDTEDIIEQTEVKQSVLSPQKQEKLIRLFDGLKDAKQQDAEQDS